MTRDRFFVCLGVALFASLLAIGYMLATQAPFHRGL